MLNRVAAVPPPLARLRDKTVVITGASDGIGAAAARQLADAGAVVIPVGRSPGKTASLADELGVDGEIADFEKLDDVRDLAARLRERCKTIDVLINNAGGTFSKRATTVDGNERTMQVNHLAPYLLTRLLEEPLRRDAHPSQAPGPGSARPLNSARIVTTASSAAQLGRFRTDDLRTSLKSAGLYVGFRVYSKTKLANILFAAELSRRWPEITSTSYHPGAVASQFGRGSGLVGFLFAVPQFRAMIRTPDQGADTMLWLASAADSAGWYSGGFFSDRAPARAPSQADDLRLATDLWNLSADLVGLPRS